MKTSAKILIAGVVLAILLADNKTAKVGSNGKNSFKYFDEEYTSHQITYYHKGDWDCATCEDFSDKDYDNVRKEVNSLCAKELEDALYPEFGGKYSTQPSTWIDEDGNPVMLEIRIADHSENRGAGRGEDYRISFITSANDATENRFMSSKSIHEYNISGMSVDEARQFIRSKIAEYVPKDADEMNYKKIV